MNAWELLFELMMAERARMPSIAAELELSPMQVQLLRLIEPDQPVPMGKAACGLGCDASNITGIVDRLEARGLIERRPGTDRRVKVLVITTDGARVRQVILTRLAEPPAAIARLSAEDQRMLAEILARALAPAV
ncbi:MAG: MarR family winged helix-turn-helix transcriptional regulator [Gaiellales bacterium]|jgi:MarR family transcriptional regulator, organic hydroperoxide resistance regulator